MPAVPARLAEDPHWGAYLAQRAHLVTDLAEQVRTRATDQAALPAWAQNGLRPEAAPVANVEVWRYAMQVPAAYRDRKSVVSGQGVSVRVDLGGRRIIKNKLHMHNTSEQ